MKVLKPTREKTNTKKKAYEKHMKRHEKTLQNTSELHVPLASNWDSVAQGAVPLCDHDGSCRGTYGTPKSDGLHLDISKSMNKNGVLNK
jgi:hypothetical protein